MANRQLWYTRREMEIRGPFPAGMVTRYILLGRILETDQVSTDQVSWHPVSDFPDLIPEELKLDLTKEENLEKLRIARMREDERGTGDRRSETDSTDVDNTGYRKRGNDRRKSEPMDVMRHREIKTQLLTSLREKQQKHYLPRIIGILMTISVVIAMVWWYG